MHHLSEGEYSPFISPYLMGGYTNDEFYITKIYIDEGCICGRFTMKNYFVSPNTGVFHLTVPVALLCIFQLALIYGCIDNNLTSRRGEAYMREFNMKCKRVISDTTFDCTLQLNNKHVFRDSVLYKGHVSIENDAFVATASFLLPI